MTTITTCYLIGSVDTDDSRCPSGERAKKAKAKDGMKRLAATDVVYRVCGGGAFGGS
jgi:hypothetical protein